MNKIAFHIKKGIYNSLSSLAEYFNPRNSGKLERYAKNEFFYAGWCVDETATVFFDEMQGAICRNILAMIREFGNAGHSGFSASYTISLIEKLLKFEPIAPLTGKDDEWNLIDYGSGSCDSDVTWQNKRCSRVFKKENGQAYDIDGKVWIETYLDDAGIEQQASFTNFESRVDVIFPYIPKIEYVDVLSAKEKIN